MKLYWSSRSPFARKVSLAACELGLLERMELVPTVVSILKPDAALLALNPLSMIPTLVLDDGAVMHDSLVICEYLDMISGKPRLFPQQQPARAEALSRHATGQALMETLVRWFGERKRGDDPLQPAYIQAHRDKFNRTLDAVNAACKNWPAARFDIGDIAVAVLLTYADFRFEQEQWRQGRDHLAHWFAQVEQRASMRATAFVAP
ncbi:glutathione S-transferase family protein [Herbaspirillum lusitanum]|uniref:Glutathione S-transferase family protein n=1 Tax=Herbaspirillum lusitanum TaxID=213312 RepID=A0ABW9AEL8_9BURK